MSTTTRTAEHSESSRKEPKKPGPGGKYMSQKHRNFMDTWMVKYIVTGKKDWPLFWQRFFKAWWSENNPYAVDIEKEQLVCDSFRIC